MKEHILYIARLPCGCVIDLCTSWDDERLWLYGVRGNGWAVETYNGQEAECAACRGVNAYQQTRMF